MAGNSLASILAWMKTETRMLKWGLVVALERRKTNLIIVQEYIKRFDDSSYLPPIRGEVTIVENRQMELVHDFVMAAPVLSFENADLNDSKALLTMAVMGGSQLTLERKSEGWKAYKVDEINPLQGPTLFLDLLLNEVPGDVDKDGRIKLDLSKSDNFRLTFGVTAHEQRLGGDFFKDLFNQLPDSQRIYTLGKIAPGTNELMRPKSFELRTQASGAAARDPKSSEYGNGAVLAFIRTAQRNGGNFPGTGYRYLVPDDAEKDYSATVLFDRAQTTAGALLGAVGALFGTDKFDYTYDDGELISATLSAGKLYMKGVSIDQLLPEDLGGGKIQGTVRDFYLYPGLDTSHVTVTVDKNKCSVQLVLSAVTLGIFRGTYIPVYTLPVVVAIAARAEYELIEGEAGLTLIMTDFNFSTDVEEEEQTSEDGANDERGAWLNGLAL